MPFKPDYKVPQRRQAYTFFGEPREGWEGIGCLMLHGFMGSPVSSRDMAKFIADKGVTVHCPLLPGHGNLPYQIHGYGKEDWLAEVAEAYDHLRERCDQIFLIGHSMGAALAASLATRHRDVCGLILLAPLYKVPDWRINFAAVGRIFMPFLYPLKHKAIDRDIFLGRVTDFDPTIDVHDPELQDWLVEATRIPVDATDEMRKVSGLGRKLWSKIHQPVIIFQGGNDPAVSPGNTEKLFQLLPTADKEMKFFPKVGHELMRPVEPIHKKVWQKIAEFIEEHVEIGRKYPTALNAPSLLVGKSSSKGSA